jgi:hypothetical protein
VASRMNTTQAVIARLEGGAESHRRVHCAVSRRPPATSCVSAS